MKRLLFSVILVTVSIMTFAQNVRDDVPTVGYLCNSPLPYKPANLNVLFIGNSFSIDTTAGLTEIFKNMNIRNVNVYVLYKGGCSMKEHYEYFLSNKSVYEFYIYNISGERRIERKISIREAMSYYNYDIVIWQQYSLDSGDYTTYEPYLSKLIQGYKTIARAPRTTFAFNMTWAYSSKHKELKKYGTQENMYRQICKSIKKMKAISGIDVIIPCGTAVQNARNMTSLVTENEFTRDNYHIDKYMGRYLLACTFFEAILAPTMELNLRSDTSIYGKNSDANQVNNSNRDLLKKCARLSIANNFEVSEFVNDIVKSGE